MQKVTGLVGFLLLTLTLLSVSNPPKPAIQWMSVQDAMKAYDAKPKPIFVDVYTDWCGWCKEMDRTSFRHPKLVEFINANFYPVKFNAESPDTVLFNGRQFSFNMDTRAHRLAEYLLDGQLEFPAMVFLPAPGEKPAALFGYMKARELEAPLRYFADSSLRAMSFIEFNKNFRGSWK